MPIYEYRCGDCGHEFETIQKISEEPLTLCPACEHETLKKKVSRAAFRLKGAGWYETDFKSSNKRNVAGSGDSSDSGSSGKSDSGSAGGSSGGDSKAASEKGGGDKSTGEKSGSDKNKSGSEKSGSSTGKTDSAGSSGSKSSGTSSA